MSRTFHRTRLIPAAGLFFNIAKHFPMIPESAKISDFDYGLPEERIAKFPADNRDGSKLLVYRGGDVSESVFKNIGGILPAGSMLVFNNTKVIRARLIMHKPSGARIEIFCLEPHSPSDYERAFSVKESCRWLCIVGGLKKWKTGPLEIPFDHEGKECRLLAFNTESRGRENIIRFEWDADITFGKLLEHLGKIPIPPYLNRDTQDIDYDRYQTVFSRFEGSVAAPTAGLHFTPALIDRLKTEGFPFGEVTLHVGAGTFLPVKEESVADHTMHTEHFEITRELIGQLIANYGKIIPVGTTSVRTLESLSVLGYRILTDGAPETERPIGQWEAYRIPREVEGKTFLQVLMEWMVRKNIGKINASTQIMIMPGYEYRVINGMITNFHQPKSTLLLLVSAFIGDDWRRVYDYALQNGFRFLSYGDSSVLLK